MPSRSIVALVLSCGIAAVLPTAEAGSHRSRSPRSPSAVIVIGNGSPARRAAAVRAAPRGVLDLNVKPKATEVWINDRYRGTCGAFDGNPGKLHLPAGLHDLKLVLPDGTVATRQVRVRGGVEVNVGLDLR